MSYGEAWGDYDSFVSPIPNDVTIEEVKEMDSVPLSVRATPEKRHTSKTTIGAALADEEERKAEQRPSRPSHRAPLRPRTVGPSS